jgi:hypothetical protein
MTHLAGFWTVAPALSKGDVNPGQGRMVFQSGMTFLRIVIPLYLFV